jgi:hypothetical protein
MGKMCECLSHIQRLFNDCCLGGDSQCCQFVQEAAQSVEDFLFKYINQKCNYYYPLLFVFINSKDAKYFFSIRCVHV